MFKSARLRAARLRHLQWKRVLIKTASSRPLIYIHCNFWSEYDDMVRVSVHSDHLIVFVLHF